MALKICEEDHEQIVFNEYDHYGKTVQCPVCEARAEIDAFEKENAELVENIDKLKARRCTAATYTTKQELLDALRKLSEMLATYYNPIIYDQIGVIRSMIDHLPDKKGSKP
mgnify:CR=1 FL=1